MTLLCHEVDELLDTGQQGRLEVGVAAHGAEDLLPGSGDVRLAVVRPAEVLADAVLPRLAAGDDRPAATAPAARDARSATRRRTGVPARVRARHTGSWRPPRRRGAPWCRAAGGPRAPPTVARDRAGTGAIAPTRSSTPSSISTTTPSTRRSAPQTFSTSSASCRPSTKIRDPLATLALAPSTARDPEAVREAAARASASCARAAAVGGVSTTGAPSSRKPGPIGKPLVRPRRSSRWTTRIPPAFSTRTTAPHQPVSTSSTTSPVSASTSRERPARGHLPVTGEDIGAIAVGHRRRVCRAWRAVSARARRPSRARAGPRAGTT